MKELIIVKKDIAAVDLNPLKKFITYSGMDSWYDYEPGKSEYRLYAYLSHKIENTSILEIGTGLGASAVALSANESNNVISFDLKQTLAQTKLDKQNVELRLGNFMKDESIDYDNIDLIMIDVDPHDGLQEPVMIDYILSKGWTGILLMDDISLSEWPALHMVWDRLPFEKYDLTDIGHWSGTGLVNVGSKFQVTVI